MKVKHPVDCYRLRKLLVMEIEAIIDKLAERKERNGGKLSQAEQKRQDADRRAYQYFDRICTELTRGEGVWNAERIALFYAGLSRRRAETRRVQEVLAICVKESNPTKPDGS